MARLIVKLHGQEMANLKLEPGQDYIAGRAPDAQIRLHEERGISRHHLKFYEREGAWVCESLSKFVLIQIGTQSAEVLELTETTTFSLPPYEFFFDPENQPQVEQDSAAAENAPVQEPQNAGQNLPTFYNPRAAEEVPSDTSPNINSEATMAGQIHLVPYIRISYPNTADDEVLKLEGHLWVVGREPDCEIFVDSPHISRRHFEIARTNEGFFITDLGSSNGTKINGQRIHAHEPTKIDSGDEIQVMNIAMSFEIRDTQFANRLGNLPVPAFDPMLLAPQQWQHEANLVPIDHEPRRRKKKGIRGVRWKKHKVRIILIFLVPVLLYGLLQNPKPKEPDRAIANSGTSVSFDTLTPERKNVVKDSFHLARNLYVQGKYALCLTELAKVHEIIPQFENSKEMQSFCEQGLELVRRQEDLDRKERERAMIEQQILGYVEGCKQKLKESATVDETRQCLAEAVVLAPEHPLVIEMIHTAQMHEQETKFMEEQLRAEQEKAEVGFSHFKKAMNIYKSGKLAAAITEFERFINKNYPRNADKREEARRQIASIKSELSTKIKKFLGECKALAGKGRYKEAYMACDKAVAEDADHSEAKSLRGDMLKELTRQMKVIYQDSVLEESLGNVESAKEKWRKIMAEDLDFNEYAVKAKSKLQKYGGGL